MFSGTRSQGRDSGSRSGNLVNNMITDSISDFLTRVRNGYMAGNSSVSMPASKAVTSLAKAMEKNGYLKSVEIKEDGVHKELILKLKYNAKESVLTGVRRVSRPSMRIYTTKKDIQTVMGGMGISIISTPNGLMTNKEARKAGLGGEVICELW